MIPKRTIPVIAVFMLCVLTGIYADDLLLQPAAVVNLIRSQVIPMQEVDATFDEYRMTQQRQGLPVELTKEDILQVLIENELLIQGARQFGTTVSEQEVTAEFNAQKQSVEQQLGRRLTDAEFSQVLSDFFDKTVDGFRTEIRNQILVDRYVRTAKRSVVENVPAPTLQEVQTVYRQNATSFTNPEYALLRHIYVDNRNKSDSEAYAKISSALRRIQSGAASFDSLVLEVSEDEGTKFQSGEMGWLAIDDAQRKQMLGAEFFDKVFELETGEISGIINSNAGYHIVKMQDYRPAKMLGLYDTINPSSRTTVYQYISNQLYAQKQANAYNRAIDELVEELRKKADIRVLL